MKYDFHLRSGKTVTIDVAGRIEDLINGAIKNIARSGRDDHEWLSEPGMHSAVRWSDIEGWNPTPVSVDCHRNRKERS